MLKWVTTRQRPASGARRLEIISIVSSPCQSLPHCSQKRGVGQAAAQSGLVFLLPVPALCVMLDKASHNSDSSTAPAALQRNLAADVAEGSCVTSAV